MSPPILRSPTFRKKKSELILQKELYAEHSNVEKEGRKMKSLRTTENETEKRV